MAIGRNPGTFGKIFAIMILGIALAEGAAIVAFVLGKAQ
jgi:F0F1-type ATP synthase membrane subunit c/vacuolar-type H+-ATPase subunit K